MGQRICGSCGSPTSPPKARGPWPTYCSKKCRDHASYLRQKESGKRGQRKEPTPRPCRVCGLDFLAVRTDANVCSKRCSSRLHRDSPTKICEREGCTNPLRARGLCGTHYNKLMDNRGNPETRRKSLRKKTQRRRALMYDADAERIDRDEVGDRDGWRCGLCGKRVDKTRAWPDPRSASLDHILPLSKGGKHRRDNVHISHLACNLAKNAGGEGEQLLLIG